MNATTFLGRSIKSSPVFGLQVVGSDDSEAAQWVFTNKEGNLIDKDNWRRRIFAKAVKKAEVKKIRVHSLRHTYATLRISKGDNIGHVSNQLGHHSVKLTLDTYYHWMPGKKKSEVDALDDPSLTHPSTTYPQPGAEEIKQGAAING